MVMVIVMVMVMVWVRVRVRVRVMVRIWNNEPYALFRITYGITSLRNNETGNFSIITGRSHKGRYLCYGQGER